MIVDVLFAPVMLTVGAEAGFFYAVPDDSISGHRLADGVIYAAAPAIIICLTLHSQISPDGKPCVQWPVVEIVDGLHHKSFATVVALAQDNIWR